LAPLGLLGSRQAEGEWLRSFTSCLIRQHTRQLSESLAECETGQAWKLSGWFAFPFHVLLLVALKELMTIAKREKFGGQGIC